MYSFGTSQTLTMTVTHPLQKNKNKKNQSSLADHQVVKNLYVLLSWKTKVEIKKKKKKSFLTPLKKVLYETTSFRGN